MTVDTDIPTRTASLFQRTGEWWRGLTAGRRRDGQPHAADRAGRVALVGCGPGEPDLLTLRAADRIRAADVLFYDRLTDPAILDLARPDAERVYVGKRCGEHSMPQARINALLVAHVRRGRRVARLKGGDPFIFGRGGEELGACLSAGVSCEVVPGVTAALGCAAATGIPLTHRGVARAVTFVTGHCKDGELPGVDWRALVNDQQTVVFYMGLGHFAALRERLIANGVPPQRPVAVIRNGTRAEQGVECGTLADAQPAAGDGAPALIVLGDCVNALDVTAALSTATAGR